MLQGSVYRIALRNGGQSEYDAVLRMFRGTTTDSVRKWATSTLGSTSSSALKRNVMEWAVSGEVKLQDCFYPMSSVANSSPEGTQVAWSFFKENFERLRTLTASANAWMLQYIIAACCGRLATEAEVDEMTSFFEAHPVPTASRKISQIKEKILATAKFAKMTSHSKLMESNFWNSLQ